MSKTPLLVLIVLAGCATSKPIFLPSGQRGFAIKCDGSARSWNGCYELAGRMCGAAGYDIVNRQGESSPSVVANQYGLIAGDTVHRSLLIACK